MTEAGHNYKFWMPGAPWQKPEVFLRHIKEVCQGHFAFTESDAEVLVVCLRAAPGDYLEIGTAYGTSLMIAAKFGRGEAHSIDPLNAYYSEARERSKGYIHLTPELLMSNLKAVGVEAHLHLAKHPPMPKELVGHKFSVALIDGEHSPKAALADFRGISDSVTGFILFHDIDMEGPKKVFAMACETDDWEPWLSTKTIGVVRRK
jgi:hypothetical protein